jgi:hypothetical protein
MNTKKIIHLNKIIWLTFLATLVLLPFTSCTRKMTFHNSSIVPGAEGHVKITTDKNKNYVLKLTVSNLADVSRLTPPRNTYVVWMETDQGKTENLGQLKTSSRLRANLVTVSSFNPTRIYITAEDNASIQSPGREVVLSTSGFQN